MEDLLLDHGLVFRKSTPPAIDLLRKDGQMIQAIERGERNPTMFTIIQLAEALDVPAYRLFDFLHEKSTVGK